MKCPSCGYKRQKRDDAYVSATECPSCGIVYSKRVCPAVPEIPNSNATAPSFPPPSPVDPESLKKAKHRVEKRLRKRLESTAKDEHYARTLALARKLTESAVRERQRQKTEVQDKISDEIRIEPSDDCDLELHNCISNEKTDINQTSDDTDDVQVETIHLESTELSIGPTPENPCQTNESASVDDAAVGEKTQLPPAHIASKSTTAGAKNFEGALKCMLPVIAWLILFSGIIGAVLCWTTISDVEAGVKTPVPNGMGSPSLGLLLGFAYLATGALGFAFFWVSSLISRQLKDIRRLLMVHPIARVSKQTNGTPHPNDVA